MNNHEESHGPLQWSTQCSVELQRVADNFIKGELHKLEFSVTVADPSAQDCPLVACSIGFTSLTGYWLHEIVGRNCRFLLNGVPSNLIGEGTRHRCRSFCKSVKEGREYDGGSDVLPPDGLDLPDGELICIQTNAKKTGELFRNMFYLKQVELDGAPYIVALQAGIPDEYGEDLSLEMVQEMCYDAWKNLDGNMSIIELLLASQFWYQGTMRRQDNLKELDMILKL